MRKIQKKQIQKGIWQLLQTSKEIKKRIEEQSIDQARELLGQCQCYAVELGTVIEDEEGKDHAAVHALEMYCEWLYQIYIKVGEVWGREDIDHTFQEPCGILKRAEDLVQAIKEHREVVFFPYKAAMWDSLESIWLAASEDPACIASVIPIPYYDRRSDGSLGRMHYEGSLYPDYVPIVDHRGYDLQQHRPDMIFIHDPYDGYNYVTSVHPFFYSSNLKRYTEKLVYIPYFTLEEIAPDDQEAVAEIEHFCTVPGVLWADRVIVQSEAMRQIYIEVMTRFVGGAKKIDWEKKILGLGSPKADRIQRKRKEDLKVPKEWKKHLQRPDGSWKKVVFYNISLKALPQYREQMLEKIRAVLHLFRQNREEIVLLWRPHPLIQATLESVDIDLWEAYHRIVEQYKKEDWGIYDDTADIDRAVLLCDAYYGDRSSVVQLCQEAGKIILIQNVETAVSDREQLLSRVLIFENAYDDGSCFWFTGYDLNALFRMDKEERKVGLAGVFPDEELMQWRAYTSTVCCDGKLYLAPHFAKEIAGYDPEKDLFRKIPIDSPPRADLRKWEDGKFFKSLVIGKKIYFIPYHYPGILCYDTQTDTSICFDDWVEKIEEIRVSEWGYFFVYERSGSRLILPCACADAVVIFDTATGMAQVIQTPKTGYMCKFCGVSRVGDFFYLVSADGTVQKRRLEATEEEGWTIRLPSSGLDVAEYYPIQRAGEMIYLFPFKKGKVMRIDTRTDQIGEEVLFEDEIGPEGDNFCFLTSIYDGKSLYVSTGNNRRFVGYDLVNGEKKGERAFLSKEDRRSLEKEKKKGFIRRAGRGYVVEDSSYPLAFMLDVLQADDIWVEKRDRCDGSTIGKRIYETLISG